MKSARQRFDRRNEMYGHGDIYGRRRSGSGLMTDAEFSRLMRSVDTRRSAADRDRRRRDLELLTLSAPPAGELVVRAEGKHFWLVAYVDGAPIRMMVDSGATNTVLSAEDARRAGVAATGQVDVLTARGTIRAASATIRRLAIGTATFHQLPAVIVERGRRGSLLGADALARFKSVELRDGEMVFRW